jgi:hypothetical protein
MVLIVDGRLDFQRPLEPPVLTPELARLLLQLALRRLDQNRCENGREVA